MIRRNFAFLGEAEEIRVIFRHDRHFIVSKFEPGYYSIKVFIVVAVRSWFKENKFDPVWSSYS